MRRAAPERLLPATKTMEARSLKPHAVACCALPRRRPLYYQIAASLPGGERKIVTNKDEADVMTSFIVPFLETSTINTKWGKKTYRRQALELRVYGTEKPFDRRSGKTFDQFVKNRKNRFNELAKKAKAGLGPTTRVFVVMPIQGEQYGDQEEQRVFKEYDERFEAIERILNELDCYAIRIDKEAPLEGLVDRIKDEIRQANFIVADLTDERQSCYYEVGYADAFGVPVIPIASEQSVMKPGTKTKIHFDIHRNISFFRNHNQMMERLRQAVEKNREILFADVAGRAAATERRVRTS
jgi:hypothetical protein